MLLMEDRVGEVLKRYPYLDEIFYMFTDNPDLVFDDADYSLRDFAEMVGADIEELLRDLQKKIDAR